jgi:hypothetical protein
MSTMHIAMLLTRRFFRSPYGSQQSHQLICNVFNLIKSSESAMCCYNVDIYEDLLINVASLILVSDYSLFENVENILIQNILNTEYWPALFSSDLWMIIMRFDLISFFKYKENLFFLNFFFFRYLSPDSCILQFSKLAKLFEALIVFPCFTQCPQNIYLEMLLKRHFSLITNKNQLVNFCPQLKLPSLKSTIGILHVSTLSEYNQLSEMVLKTFSFFCFIFIF